LGSVKDKIADKIDDIKWACKLKWWEIKDKLTQSSESSGSMDSYDSEKASLRETQRVNEALTKFRYDVEKESRELEAKALEVSRKSIDSFISTLEEHNYVQYGGRRLNLNLRSIERENREAEDRIHNFIQLKATKRVSLDDAECLKILKMDKGEAKTQAMRDFQISVFASAINDLTDELKKCAQKQCDNLIDTIQDRVDELNGQSQMLANEYKIVRQNLESGDVKAKEEWYANCMVTSDLCDYAISLL